jgi:hypothetical protein
MMAYVSIMLLPEMGDAPDRCRGVFCVLTGSLCRHKTWTNEITATRFLRWVGPGNLVSRKAPIQLSIKAALYHFTHQDDQMLLGAIDPADILYHQQLVNFCNCVSSVKSGCCGSTLVFAICCRVVISVYRSSQLRGKCTCPLGSACYNRISCDSAHVATTSFPVPMKIKRRSLVLAELKIWILWSTLEAERMD